MQHIGFIVELICCALLTLFVLFFLYLKVAQILRKDKK